ncbi:MAG: tyrosine decarboxylase MfnA [Asgard group archaeon]|nr:tyrosine decarboxylase MfnA [Asgard group archaeon]
MLADDKSYSNVLSSMCTPPNDISRLVAGEFAEINLGDPGLFPTAIKMEQDVLSILASFLNAPKKWHGSITSGGSESNLLGCWTARNWGRQEKGIKNGRIIFPKSAHVSFEKAIDLLSITPDWIDLNQQLMIDIEAVKENITDETVGIIGIAGTTGTGICDDIKALSEIAIDHNLYLHVDAAYGGTVFPFLTDLGRVPPQFAFENEGVKSITIDTHKILGGLIPGGAIIYRSKEFSNLISKNITYLSDSSTTQITITGTRPANSMISSWILLKKFGRKYLVNRVKKALFLTNHLISQFKKIPEIELVFQPNLNIIGFTCTVFTTKELVEKLKDKDWLLSIYDDWIRIVVMPHLEKKIISKFVNDLKSIIKEKKF